MSNPLTENDLKAMSVGSIDELIHALGLFGIPEGLVSHYPDGFALFNLIGQGLARRTPVGWAFTQFPEGYLDGVRAEVKNAEHQAGGVKAYVSGVVDAHLRFVKRPLVGEWQGLLGYPGTQGLTRAHGRKTPFIVGTLHLSETDEIIPNSRHEGGIEKAFEEVSDRQGGLIGIVGGFDFLATLAANGRFSHIVGIDINPYQVIVGAIRAALCEISTTPFHYLSNLLSLDIDDEDYSDYTDLRDFFETTEQETPSITRREETWRLLEPILQKETGADIGVFRQVWDKMSDLYSQQNVRKTSVVTGSNVNIYLRELQEVSLRWSRKSVSWLATQKNYDRVKSLIGSGNFVLIVGDLFGNGIEMAEAYLRDQCVKCGALYISNVPSYVHPSDEQLARLDAITARLRESGVLVTEGSHGRGRTSGDYKAPTRSFRKK